MRTEFILDTTAAADAGFPDYLLNDWRMSGSAEEAERLAPWAAVVAPVEGGWIAYESRDDYETDQRQK
jgi:hypothetical protein